MVTPPILELVAPSCLESIELIIVPCILSPVLPIDVTSAIEPPKSTFGELHETLEHVETKRLEGSIEDVGHTYLPRRGVHDSFGVSRMLSYSFSGVGNACLYVDWAQQFDKLKQALTCAIRILSFI